MQALPIETLGDMVATAILAAITGSWSPIAFWIWVVLALLSVAESESHMWATIPLGSKLSPTGNNSWVSPDGTFAMGFYPALDQADAYGVGIRYNSVPVEQRIVVWTAGEDLKVSPAATLELTMDGNLVLLDRRTGVSAWTSNTSHRGVVGAVLRDNGNFVLSDAAHRTVWESFETPTDTLVPGQRLHVGQMLRAASRNSVASYYSLAMESSGNLSLKWESSVSYWESGTGSLPSHSIPRGAILAGNGVFGLFDRRGRMVWSRYSNDFTDSTVILRYLRLDVDGNLRMYSWVEKSRLWKSGWQAVENQCDVFATCGVYGVCSFDNNMGPVCNCPFPGGFDVKDTNDPSNGCRRLVPLGACNGGVMMLVLKRTVLYGLYPPHDVYNYTSSEKCKENCLYDDLCVAATAMNDGSGLCKLKRTEFISGYRYSSLSAISFLKVCLVPQAVPTHITPNKGINQPNSIAPYKPSSSSTDPPGTSRLRRTSLIGASLATLGVFLVIEIAVGWYFCRRKMKGKGLQSGKLQLLDLNSRALIRMSYAETEELTGNFKQKLGPTVFKGVLPNKKIVVVKQLDVGVGEQQFRKKLSILGSIHHRNIVRLQGFCCDCKHRLLVYEYYQNGSLDQWLFGGSMKQAKRLSWQKRMDIAKGVARAIAYLHSECIECISHGNLKLENVLLDDELVAKVTDFGLDKLTICSKSHGKFDQSTFSSEPCPEWDIFCFGQILLEIISGKRDPACDCSKEDKLCAWAYHEYQSGHSESIPDSRMEGSVDQNELERTLRIAFWCLQEQSSLRPSMNEVAKVLDGSLPVDPPPIPLQDSQVGVCSMLHEKPEGRYGAKYLELTSASYCTAPSAESSSL